MGYTGILGFTPDNMAKIVAKALGASKLKMKYSNGCLELKRKIPKKRNTLGKVILETTIISNNFQNV